jgi:hypothetical protein
MDIYRGNVSQPVALPVAAFVCVCVEERINIRNVIRYFAYVFLMHCVCFCIPCVDERRVTSVEDRKIGADTTAFTPHKHFNYSTSSYNYFY